MVKVHNFTALKKFPNDVRWALNVVIIGESLQIHRFEKSVQICEISCECVEVI